MKTEALIKLAVAAGIIALTALVLAFIENRNTSGSPVGSLRRWMIYVLMFLAAAAVTVILLIIVFIKIKKK